MNAPSRHPNAPRERPSGASRTQTTFRRRLTRNFSSIDNQIINDMRLALDERMALIWALSRPDDWQFHPGQLREAWGVGRVVYYRIIRALKKIGYLKIGEMIRSTDNRYWIAMSYVFFDVPQEPDGPIAGEDDTDSADEDIEDSPPPDVGESECVTNSSHVGFVHADDLHAGDRPVELKIDITNNPPTPLKPKPPPMTGEISSEDKSVVPLPNAATPVTGSGSGPPMRTGGNANAPAATPVPVVVPAIEEFLAAWQRIGGPCVSEDRVRRVWLRWTDPERVAALARLPDFAADRVRRKWKLCDAATYLRDRLWQAFPARPAIFELTPNMPEWHRWKKYYIDSGRAFMAEQMDTMARQKKSFPSKDRWPPGCAATPEPDANDRENTP